MDPVKILLFSVLLGVNVCTCSGRWVPDDGEVWIKIRTRLLFPNDFISVGINSHSERELRISYGKVLLMETFLRSGYSPDYDFVLRQVTDGRRILQAVLQGGVLKECDVSKDSNQMLDFLSNFVTSDKNSSADFGDVFYASGMTNYTVNNTTLAYLNVQTPSDLGEFRDYINMKTLRRECEALLAEAQAVSSEQATASGEVTSVYEQILANSDPKTFADLNKDLNIVLPDGVAPPLDQAPDLTGSDYHNLLTSESQKDKYVDHNLSKRSTAPVKRSRQKRAALDFNSVLIFPGTKWCGKGDLAQCYEDLGEDQDLDMCCRDHDCCPYIIPPFSSRFNMFNYRFHSLLHCDCDQRFRGCLRQSLSSMANMIGKIYFNILGSKCFEFVETDICIERSWWGRCQKYEKQVAATVKNQISFHDDTHVDENTTE